MKRLVKWVIVALVLGELYSRGGRELLLGQRDDGVEWGVGDTFRMWVEYPRDYVFAESPVGKAVFNGTNEIGRVVEFDPAFETKDMAGYPAVVPRVRVEVLRAYLGWPINVAMSEVATFTRQSI